MTFNQTIKPVRKKVKKIFNRDRLFKLLMIISSLALLSTSVLPYLIK